MNRKELTDDIVALLTARFSEESHSYDIRTDASFEEMGFDSLDRLDIVLTIEAHYGVRVPRNAIRKLHTMDDVVNMLLTLKPDLCKEK